MKNRAYRSLGSPSQRLFFGFVIFLLCIWDPNPLVQMQAELGLSPSPLERIFGIKSAFSGMTEGVFRLFKLDLIGSFKSNPFSPLIVILGVVFVISGQIPRFHDKKEELIALLVFAGCSIIVNIVEGV